VLSHLQREGYFGLVFDAVMVEAQERVVWLVGSQERQS
jgi:hypothetical protein